MGVISSMPVYTALTLRRTTKFCDHKYKEVSASTNMDRETYECSKCGDRYHLYYEDMA